MVSILVTEPLDGRLLMVGGDVGVAEGSFEISMAHPFLYRAGVDAHHQCVRAEAVA